MGLGIKLMTGLKTFVH